MAATTWERPYALDKAGPLLETKLYVLGRRRAVVPRPRLRELLDRGAESKLTLISAPAGFGKTTLFADWLVEWVAAAPARGRAAGWLSLDQSDNHPATFWTYLIAVPCGSPRPRGVRSVWNARSGSHPS